MHDIALAQTGKGNKPFRTSEERISSEAHPIKLSLKLCDSRILFFFLYSNCPITIKAAGSEWGHFLKPIFQRNEQQTRTHLHIFHLVSLEIKSANLPCNHTPLHLAKMLQSAGKWFKSKPTLNKPTAFSTGLRDIKTDITAMPIVSTALFTILSVKSLLTWIKMKAELL